MNFATDNKDENIQTAKSILNGLGITDITFSGYSDANGVSVYFKTSKDLKCRVSNHTVMNRDRMANELLVSFDFKTIGMGGKIGVKSSFEINKIMVKRFVY